jgi:hypothetical protein
VLFAEKVDEYQYRGAVEGTADEPYEVLIDVILPRQSHCNCPHADGKRIVCKHQIAVYFKTFPKEAKKYKKELDDYYEEEEQRYDRIEEELAKHLKKSTKQELMEMVWDLLYEGPEWQFNRFVDRYLDVD